MKLKEFDVKKFVKENIILIPIILIGVVLCYFTYRASCNYNLQIKNSYVFGGDGDWQNQHLVFFDYIRNIFLQFEV